MWGFDNLKDILDVVIVPIALFALGMALPWWFARSKRVAFVNLIRRELREMEPEPEPKKEGGNWHDHLTKRFIHEEIITNPSEHRDFILSLDPDLAYNQAQMWIQFKKAKECDDPVQLHEYGERWCKHLKEVCSLFDRKPEGKPYTEVYERWKQVIDRYQAT